MEAGSGHFTNDAEDCPEDGLSNDKGRCRTQDREHHPKNAVRKEVIFVSYINRGISYKVYLNLLAASRKILIFARNL